MDTQENKFLQQLRATFQVEAAEHEQAIAAGFQPGGKPKSNKKRRSGP
ncbi:hypothetical protein LP414_22235 [Polaromonas sp. P1(28)-13]|nr:hypothetical protein LP416_20695 [Polaromonas sp. P2-4]UUZ74875.1 hypothetical protein LP414_22235 [Polaromonas sp. P1(28)-13]